MKQQMGHESSFNLITRGCVCPVTVVLAACRSPDDVRAGVACAQPRLHSLASLPKQKIQCEDGTKTPHGGTVALGKCLLRQIPAGCGETSVCGVAWWSSEGGAQV